MLHDDSLDFLLAHVSRLHHQRVHQLLGDLGLHHGQPPIMFALWREDGLSQKDLARMLHLAPTTVNIMLGRMEKARLLERRRDDRDMRISRVYLTEHGKSLQQQVEKVRLAMEVECSAGFTPEERLLLRRFLRHLADNLSRTLQTMD